MKKAIIIIGISLSCISGYGQSAQYVLLKIEAETNIRLLPKYGDVKKSEYLAKIDSDFIKEVLKTYVTGRKGSEHYVGVGFDYLAKGDPKTAMYRFNQAWLLDPSNENVFWGFGGMYFNFQDYENALKQYDEGLRLNPNSSNILTDKATVFMTRYNENRDEGYLNRAIEIFRRSYDIDPKNQNTLFKMSVCYYLKSDCGNAVKYYKECMLLGGRPVSREFAREISKGCKL